ncbi:hypothetical protein [Halospeciosus flavus]|uniref:Major facilitator superfamily (MFS) profile domain-containing protein n=1 Tax=Halospeciosus flavus TaxID=3032283 RepID=A0ABD5Z0H3_9EURY|nr:hypothetical protein [Halospeciosus flavus]
MKRLANAALNFALNFVVGYAVGTVVADRSTGRRVGLGLGLVGAVGAYLLSGLEEVRNDGTSDAVDIEVQSPNQV